MSQTRNQAARGSGPCPPERSQIRRNGRSRRRRPCTPALSASARHRSHGWPRRPRGRSLSCACAQPVNHPCRPSPNPRRRPRPTRRAALALHLTQPASAPSRSSPSPPLCPLLRRGSGQPDDQSGSPTMGVCRSRVASWILPRRDRTPCLSPTLGPHDEDTACCERTRRRRAASWTDVWGVKITELDAEKTTRREQGCRGRRHRTMARSEVPEDRARTPRWPARAKTALPGRSRAVRSCGRIGRKCTTRTPSVTGRTFPSPRGYGECPARTSRPWEPLSATASEGL